MEERLEGLLQNRGGIADLGPFGSAAAADPGLLARASFPALLGWISAVRASGVLRVIDLARISWEVGFDHGVIKRLEKSTASTTALVLTRLVREGKVTEAQARAAAAGPKAALHALFEQGLVSPRGIVDTLRAVKEALLAELLAVPGAAWTFVPGDIGGKADPVTIDAPVYLAGVVRERTRDSHATELEPLLKPFMGRYPARAETLNAAVLGTAFGEKETRALEDLANGTVSLREAISVSPLMRIATLRLFVIAGMAGLVEFRETGRSKVSPEEQLDELKREVARVQAADHFVRLGLHYTSHPKHFQAAWERLSARFGPTAAERALGPEAARLCDRLKAYFDEAYSVVRHTESRRSYRHSAIGAGTMKFGSEFLLKQANILLFREEFDAAMETVEAAIDIDPRPEFLQFRAKVIQTRAEILAARSKPTTSRPSGSGRPH